MSVVPETAVLRKALDAERHDASRRTVDLPHEILAYIFSYFQPELPEPDWQAASEVRYDLYATLAACCLVSTTWCRVATPLLYHTVVIWRRRAFRSGIVDLDSFDELPWDKESACADFTCRDYPWNLRSLLRTCLGNSKLASYIKNLRSERWEWYDPYTMTRESSKLAAYVANGPHMHPQAAFFGYPQLIYGKGPDGELLHLFRQMRNELPLSHCYIEGLERCLQRGEIEAEHILLLALVHHRLETLHVGFHNMYDAPNLYDLLDDMGSSTGNANAEGRHGAIRPASKSQFSPPFHQLRALAVRCEPSRDEADMEDNILLSTLSPLFSQPLLQNVTIQYACGAFIDDEALPPSTKNIGSAVRPYHNVRSLRLARHAIDEGALVDLLQAFPNLMALCVEFTGKESDYDGVRLPTNKTLYDYAPNLEQLTWISDEKPGPILQDLRSLTRLRELTITRMHLVSYRRDPPSLSAILPESLEYLYFLEYSSNSSRHGDRESDDIDTFDSPGSWWHQTTDSVLALLAAAATSHPRLSNVVLQLSSDLECERARRPDVWVDDDSEFTSLYNDYHGTIPEQRARDVGWTVSEHYPTASVCLTRGGARPRRLPGRRFLPPEDEIGYFVAPRGRDASMIGRWR